MIWTIKNGTPHHLELPDGGFHHDYTWWQVLLHDDAGAAFPYGHLTACVSDAIKGVTATKDIVLTNTKLDSNFQLLASPENEFYELLFDTEPSGKSYDVETQISSESSAVRLIPDPKDSHTTQ